MATRYFALILGIIYLIVGVAGFIPGLMTAPGIGDPELAVDALHGELFGLFPVNILHTIVHLLIGIWGVVAYRTFGASRVFSRAIGVIFAILAIMGFIPGLATTFGLIPLYGNDIWLHAITAILGIYFGWMAPAPSGEPARTRA